MKLVVMMSSQYNCYFVGYSIIIKRNNSCEYNCSLRFNPVSAGWVYVGRTPVVSSIGEERRKKLILNPRVRRIFNLKPFQTQLILGLLLKCTSSLPFRRLTAEHNRLVHRVPLKVLSPLSLRVTIRTALLYIPHSQ